MAGKGKSSESAPADKRLVIRELQREELVSRQFSEQFAIDFLHQFLLSGGYIGLNLFCGQTGRELSNTLLPTQSNTSVEYWFKSMMYSSVLHQSSKYFVNHLESESLLLKCFFTDDSIEKIDSKIKMLLIHTIADAQNKDAILCGQFIDDFLQRVKPLLKNYPDIKLKNRQSISQQKINREILFYAWVCATDVDFMDKDLTDKAADLYIKILRNGSSLKNEGRKRIVKNVLCVIWFLLTVRFFFGKQQPGIYDSANMFIVQALFHNIIILYKSLQYARTNYLSRPSLHTVQKTLQTLSEGFVVYEKNWQRIQPKQGDAISWLAEHANACADYSYYMSLTMPDVKTLEIDNKRISKIPCQAIVRLFSSCLLEAGFKIIVADKEKIIVANSEKCESDNEKLRQLNKNFKQAVHVLSDIYHGAEKLKTLKNDIKAAIHFKYASPIKVYLSLHFKTNAKISEDKFSYISKQLNLLSADLNVRIKISHDTGRNVQLVIDDLFSLYQKVPTEQYQQILEQVGKLFESFAFNPNQEQHLQLVSTRKCNNNNIQEKISLAENTASTFNLFSNATRQRFYIKSKQEKVPSHLLETVTFSAANKTYTIKRDHLFKIQDGEFICMEPNNKILNKLKTKQPATYYAYKDYLKRKEGPSYARDKKNEAGILKVKNHDKYDTKLKIATENYRLLGKRHEKVAMEFEDKSTSTANITVLTDCKTHNKMSRF